MAGIGAVSLLQLNHRIIKKALEYRTINIVTYHNRQHIYGSNEEWSCLDKDVDLYKLVAALVNNPRNFEHEQTHLGANSVAYETRFTHSIGKFKPKDIHERGHICYMKIQEEHDQLIKDNFEYYVVTILISKHWRITSLNGPQCQQNPNQGSINYKAILKSKEKSQPWA